MLYGQGEAGDRGKATNILAEDGTAFSTAHVNLASNDALRGAGNWTGAIGLQARL